MLQRLSRSRPFTAGAPLGTPAEGCRAQGPPGIVHTQQPSEERRRVEAAQPRPAGADGGCGTATVLPPLPTDSLQEVGRARTSGTLSSGAAVWLRVFVCVEIVW